MSIEDPRSQRLAAIADAPSYDLPGDPLGDDPDGLVQRSDAEVAASFADPRASTQSRLDGLRSARLVALGRPAVMDALLGVLADPGDDPQVRRAALGALGALSFSTGSFAPYEPAYRRAMRVAASDPNPTLSGEALLPLSLDGDEYAQRLATRRLDDPASTPADRAQALNLLAADPHSGVLPRARRIAVEATDPDERTAALRLLAGDGAARDLLTSVAADTSEGVGVRTAAAVSLNTLDPAAFVPVAREIVGDPDNDDDLRAVSLTALAVAPAAVRPDDGATLANAVLAAGTPPSPVLAHAAEQYLDAEATRAGG